MIKIFRKAAELILGIYYILSLKIQINRNRLYKKFYILLFILLCFPAYGQNSNSVFHFDTENEYIDFYYALKPLLIQIYPKVSTAWVQRNTSQYESDLENIVRLADRDYKNYRKVSIVKMGTSDLGPMVTPVISSGVVLMAKRKKQ